MAGAPAGESGQPPAGGGFPAPGGGRGRRSARSVLSRRRYRCVAAVVLSWREGLLGLAERLEAPDPISATAVARALMLLCDGAGPLYQDDTERSLGEAIWWIADGMQP